jgi:hypothetical protein
MKNIIKIRYSAQANTLFRTSQIHQLPKFNAATDLIKLTEGQEPLVII